jgi:hypothetical protein
MIRALPALMALTLLLGACAGVEPFEYAEVDDIKPGPGAVTGDDGEWLILGD